MLILGAELGFSARAAIDLKKQAVSPASKNLQFCLWFPIVQSDNKKVRYLLTGSTLFPLEMLPSVKK